MTTATRIGSGAGEAYDRLAPAYDLLTAGYAHERWLTALESRARAHGLAGTRMLDLACGTGKSFLALRDRGFEVTACDISAEMLALARCKAPDVALHQLDMRALPVLGAFDLVTCLDDALNYLLEESDLQNTFAGIARNLGADGIAIWDLNTLAQYRGQFARDQIVTEGSLFVGWRAEEANLDVSPGGTVEVVIDVFRQARGQSWRRSSSLHRQRHWPCRAVERVAARAGLELVGVCGQRPGAVIDDYLDEHVHIKAIYLARRRRERAS